jgi:hypothetical protein
METYQVVLMFVFIAAVFVAALYGLPKVFGASKRDERERRAKSLEGNVEGSPVDGVPKQFPFNYKTPAGIPVGSTKEILPEYQADVFRAFEYGVQNRINSTNAKFPEWTKKTALNDCVIGLIDPHKTNGDGSPALIVSGFQSAGTVIGVEQFPVYPVQMIVLPHQADTNWKYLNYLSLAARNESEHDAEFANDRNYALSLAVSGDVHPHHKIPAGVQELVVDGGFGQGFIGKTVPKCVCPQIEPNPGKVDLSGIVVPG